MKFKIHFLLLAFTLLLSNCASTQRSSNTSTSNPELAADKLTSDMVAQLNLSNEQTTKATAINLKYLQKSQEMRQQANGDRSAMHALKATIQKDKNIEMKKVLTVSQYKKYESMQAEIKSGRGQRGSGGRGSN